MPSRYSRHPLVLMGILAVYAGLGQLGLAVGGFSGNVVPVWPSGGFALAVMLVMGRAIWPAILFGAFIVLVNVSGNVAWAFVVAIGHTLETVLGAALIERLASGSNAFQNPRTIFRFVAISAFMSTPVTAAFGVLAALAGGSVVWTDFAYLAMTWWLASLAGILVITPLALLWGTSPPGRLRILELLEGLVILSALTLVSLVVFAGRFPSDVKNYPLEFLCVPFLLWAAFRQGRRTVAVATTILSGVAVWGTIRGFGPFVRDSPHEALVLVQAYMGVMATMGAIMAAVVAEHRRAEDQLRELATTDPLTGLVNYRRLLEVLRTEISRSNRTARQFAVLFVDMNGLKRINDRHGHLVGSRALCRVADTLRQSCRAIDTPARFGGDEFAVVLPETTEEGGYVVLARVTEKLAADTQKPTVSVSGGVAVFPRDGSSPTQLLRAADKLLYEAKARNRRRVTDAEPEDELKTGTLF